MRSTSCFVGALCFLCVERPPPYVSTAKAGALCQQPIDVVVTQSSHVYVRKRVGLDYDAAATQTLLDPGKCRRKRKTMTDHASSQSTRTLSFVVIALLIAGLATIAPPSVAQLPPTHVDDFTGKPRVVIISDMGNEPDDQM